jgi:hypothetical protein
VQVRLLHGKSDDDVELTFDEHFHTGGSEVGDRPSRAWQHAAGFMDSVHVYLRDSFQRDVDMIFIIHSFCIGKNTW